MVAIASDPLRQLAKNASKNGNKDSMNEAKGTLSKEVGILEAVG